MTDRLLDVAQAAKRWNVCVETIRAWIHRGQLRAIKTPTGHWRIPESALPLDSGSTSPGRRID